MSTALEPLVAGQRLTRAEFHERYKQVAPGLKFELIEGIVHMASPLKVPHGRDHAKAMAWAGVYAMHTPGVEAYDNTSAALGVGSEVQPDVSLLIVPGRGGQTQDMDGIIGGAPELVVEVADSTRRTDLGPKLRDYERSNVLEYVVLVVEPFEVCWQIRHDGRLVRIPPDPDGLYRSIAFPGLWLDPTALATGNGPALLAALQRGLATPEHAAFVARLAGAKD